MHKLATPGLALVKYGGNAMTEIGLDPVLEDVALLLSAGWRVAVVHGGGPEIDAELAAAGHPVQRRAGLRITSEPVMQITEAVLCATVNKRLVRKCAALGMKAAGISGQDAGTLTAERAGQGELGLVGGTVTANPALVRVLLDAGYVPVIAPVAAATDASTALNVNADTAAGALAAALGVDVYLNVSNITHVLSDNRDPESAIRALSLDEARVFAASDACSAGMIPKIESAIWAVAGGVPRAVICGGSEGVLRKALAGAGTTVYPTGRARFAS